MPAIQMVLALPEGRFRRAVNALLHYEPKILRGLTWSHLGYVALLAVAFGVKPCTARRILRSGLHGIGYRSFRSPVSRYCSLRSC
jgi:hypothetical protein